MRTVPLRHLADLNPSTPEFDRIPAGEPVTFLPLETVWSDSRADHDRLVPKSDVATGYTRFRIGDVVCPKVTPTFQAGRSMVTRSVGAGTTELHILRPREGVDARWLCYAVRSKHFLDEGVTAFQGVAGLQRVPPEFVNSFRVADYAPEEQRRIADFLDDQVSRIDRIIAARREQMDIAADVLKAKVSAACAEGDLVPMRRLVSNVQTGGTPGEEADSAEGLPWYSPASFEGDLQIGAPVRRIRSSMGVRFEAESVLLVAIGATAGKVAWLDHEASGNQQLTYIKTRPELMKGRFLLHQLNARSDELRQSAPASTLPILNNESVRSFAAWAPEMDTQVQLVAEWDHLLSHGTAGSIHLGASIDLLSEYKSSLITAAVSGELDASTAGSNIPG
ncbi:restriction endonuclease subunit S [Janibacter sp. DB-40]|uniref:restriction endonuclease subunit S n=1 Tax=Janibacter sp. DB-40 TaxID=3028808 RepID=UPI002406A5A6|nr:restriction endonuclease subunit S [Janibacter sp. DB-40]